jgi:deoxyribose-phosphate aldolase
MGRLPPWLERWRGCQGLGPLIDLTLLRAEATPTDVTALYRDAVRLGVGQACVNPQWLPLLAAEAARAQEEAPRLVTVIGFPLGASGLEAKVAEAGLAVRAGARELDMVMALGAAKAGLWGEVGQEIEAVVRAVDGATPVKVIIESAALAAQEITRAAQVAVQAGAASVKTSTGFHPAGGATVDAVRRIREAAGPGIGVKASGGIRTAEDALAMLAAGADRIGTSAAASWTSVLGPGAPPLESLF